jgi:hypothetical protein
MIIGVGLVGFIAYKFLYRQKFLRDLRKKVGWLSHRTREPSDIGKGDEPRSWRGTGADQQ